jgi:hypothetical protein
MKKCQLRELLLRVPFRAAGQPRFLHYVLSNLHLIIDCFSATKHGIAYKD